MAMCLTVSSGKHQELIEISYMRPTFPILGVFEIGGKTIKRINNISNLNFFFPSIPN